MSVSYTHLETLYDNVITHAAVLTKLRSQSGKNSEKQMQSLLVPLGMPNVRFVVELNPRKEPDSKGMDSVTFLFSANKNGTLQNVASVASGGEIARVMPVSYTHLTKSSACPA